jgi:hypothetical protein
MIGFTTKIKLLQKDIFVKELKVKHFKILLKTLLGDEPSPEDIFVNLENILLEITNVSTEELEHLSIIDFILLITQIRCISIGGTIQLELTDEKNTKIELNLNKVIETLHKSINFEMTQVIENLEIEYQYPSLKSFLIPSKDNDEIVNLKSFIKKIHILNNTSILISKLNKQEFLHLFTALPASYSAKIFKHIVKIKQLVYNIDLLKHLASKELSLLLTPDTFIFFLQILFSKNLLPLYENIFALSKFAFMSPEYIEDCTPGEYTVFVKILERILKEQNTQSQSSGMPSINIGNPEFL